MRRNCSEAKVVRQKLPADCSRSRYYTFLHFFPDFCSTRQWLALEQGMVATACKRPRKPRVATGSIEICQLPFQNGSLVNLRYMLPNPKYNSINHDSIALHPRTIYTSDAVA